MQKYSTNSVIEKSLDKIREKETPASSIRWYQDSIRKLGLNLSTASGIMHTDLGQLVGKPIPGDMYLYLYSPKTKDALPYYDTAPLVIPFRSAKGGFYGMNMHYLPPLMRMQLLNRLLEYATPSPNSITNTTRLRLRWSLLNNAAKFPGIEHCVKRYLYSHVKSRFLQINPTDWRKAIVLPIESFEKATMNKVYSDARRAR
jgi:hypothetical protein